MKKLFLLIILAVVLNIFVVGCGYRLGSLLPPDLKTIAVPMFINKTIEPELETFVTNGIIDELIADGTLEVTEEENADTILLGEIIDYNKEPIRFTEDEVTREYRLIIAVRLVFKDQRHDEIMWKATRVEGESTFFIESSLHEAELEALPDAILDLSHDVVEKVVEGGW